MSRLHGLVSLLLAVLLAAGAWWLAENTEWVDQQVNVPLRGPAALNNRYAAEALLRGLDVRVARPTHLDRMPPPQATLWLESSHWDLFEDRAQRLRAWVEAGGHLVVSGVQLQAGESLSGWVPVSLRPRAAGAAASAPVQPPGSQCLDLREPAGVPPAYGDRRMLRVCGFAGGRRTLTSPATPLWALQSAAGDVFLRVAVGAGRVTVTGPMPVDNRDLVQEDHALVLMAALDVHPGQALWLVTEESRPPLLSTLWAHGAPALLLGALALAFALWRAGTRFGPPAAVPPAARRSVAEQVRGTAHFVLKHGPAALLAAQQRATEAAARKQVPHYDQLDLAARAAAIATRTSLPAEALAQALRPPAQRGRPAQPQALALLESARRRLESAAGPSSSLAQGPPWRSTPPT